MTTIHTVNAFEKRHMGHDIYSAHVAALSGATWTIKPILIAEQK